MRLALILSLVVGIPLIALTPWAVRQEETVGKPDEQHSEDEVHIKLTDAGRRAAGIESIAVSRRTMPVLVRATGVVEPNADRLAHVGPFVAGIVESVTEKGHLGVHVKPGETLAVLHSVEMGDAQSNFLKALALVKLTEKTYAREKALYEKKVSSGKELLDEESAWEQAKIERQAAEARLGILGFPKDEIAGLGKGEALPHGRMRIVAPIEGTVIDKHIVRGEFVAAGTTLFTIADLHSLWVQTHIYERDLARIKVGQVAEVLVSAYPDVRFKGKIQYVGDVMDEHTRTVKARVVVDDETHRLKPGMFTQEWIEVDRRESVLAVPESAIQSYRGAEVVFVEEEPNVFEVRKVLPGVRFGGYAEIREGIEEGEKIVHRGGFSLKSELEKESFHAGHAH